MDGERDSLPAAREREREIQNGVRYEGEGAELRIEDRGSRIEDRGSRIEDRGSRIEMISSIAIFDPRSSILDPGGSFQIFNFSLSSTNFLLMAALSFGVRPPRARSSSMMIQPW